MRRSVTGSTSSCMLEAAMSAIRRRGRGPAGAGGRHGNSSRFRPSLSDESTATETSPRPPLVVVDVVAAEENKSGISLRVPLSFRSTKRCCAKIGRGQRPSANAAKSVPKLFFLAKQETFFKVKYGRKARNFFRFLPSVSLTRSQLCRESRKPDAFSR